MIQAIFFDIDGTLIDTTTHQIPTSTITALKQLHKRGYKVAIASGRDMKNMQEIKDLDINLFDGFIASNGMCIFDKHINCIKKHSYDKETIEYLIAYANAHEMTLVFETLEDIYVVNSCNHFVDIANEYYHEITPYQRDWHGEEVVKISCFQEMNYDFEELLQHIDVQILASPTTTYDITLPHVSKLSGIHEMMNYWGLDIHNFMCFGDHVNDIEMVKGAKIGIAVKDPLGAIQLQELADDVCESAGNDGIYTYLINHHYID